MRAFLRAFLDLLDRKFPDKVVVTQSKFALLINSQSIHDKDIENLKERLDAIERNVGNINTAMGFSVPKGVLLER